MMILDSGAVLAILIALSGCFLVMCLFWKQNQQLIREVRRLQLELRDSRIK